MLPLRDRRRRPPPWWPQDEPWPPTRPRWRRRHRLFLLPLFLIVLLAITLSFSILFVVGLLGWLHEGQMMPGIPFSLARPFSFLLGLFAFIAVMVVVRMVRRITTPLGELVDAAGRIAEGDYSARVAERGTVDVRTLAHAFNSMAARLQATDEQRRNLLADVTHELKTPLTVVQGNLEGMIDGVYPLDRTHIEPILDETRILSRLIEDLRTLALAESGALQLKREPTDLVTLISETIASFRPQAEAKRVHVESELSPGIPTVFVDPSRIREVLLNLLVNAVRYTPEEGTIRVNCVFEPNPRRVRVEVSDTGQGIPAQDLPHIFDRFYKSRDSRGTGLGLTIAKNLIAAHGGEISANSTPRQGTTIQFTLPVESGER